jgi:adenylate cyclase
MALWGAPLDNPIHSYRACQSAIEMELAVKQLNKELADDLPQIEIGIGINTGNMIAGNLGSEQRFDFSVVGDNVNLASRLEGLTKYYKAGIIIGENTVEHLRQIDRFDEFGLRQLDTIRVKGKTQQVKIYQLLTKNHPTLVNEYQLAYRLYKNGDFNKAARAFNSIYTNYNDQPSKMMVERCMLLFNKPEMVKKWDGVWNWDAK